MKEMTITSAEALGKSEGEAPRRGNRATRVPAILEVAINVFATQGNAGFTQRRIASEAGIRLRTLQHYFGTREELLRATIEELARRSFARYLAIAKDKLRSPEARLDAIADEVFSVLTGVGASVGAFAIEYWCLAEHEQFARVLLEKHTGEFQEIFVGLVAKINPTLTAAECTLRGAQILAHMYGLLVYIRQSGDSGPDLDAFRQITKVVWKALSKAPQ
ncbi:MULTISPECIES: TetR/AcrR family transcriptional regulator [Paraburkholderia]|jgi:AcrR family transcriptional regulator|uniref:TetR/AcrR family transcriptional regulator n=1 Tax=Paraburkholderia madseniana TaxID=2599607 RepID=A0AAP5ESC7_9BURK|nr:MULTISPECIES: TetR/AcrR family transcriptional regulator [Paraburkholderia]MCX4149986.1 TetR/AcrR family transcriptional regulator [Paraburkholderia madseniana]MDN7152922.1 TetR/AcrR family transcriptional regulator [Paraburkholderia sp. WS6]MDQ6411804.1 TetR/AcrR family transcriptional regulator [Paraburkholderia madseniana]